MNWTISLLAFGLLFTVGCAGLTWQTDRGLIVGIEQGELKRLAIVSVTDKRMGGYVPPTVRLIEVQSEHATSAPTSMPTWPEHGKGLTEREVRTVASFNWPWYRNPGAIRGAVRVATDKRTFIPIKYVVGLSPFIVASYNEKVEAMRSALPDTPESLRVEEPMEYQAVDSSGGVRDGSPRLVHLDDRETIVNVLAICRNRTQTTEGSVVVDELRILKKAMPVADVIDVLSKKDRLQDVVVKQYKVSGD
jgi:hypothetical protein